MNEYGSRCSDIDSILSSVPPYRCKSDNPMESRILRLDSSESQRLQLVMSIRAHLIQLHLNSMHGDEFVDDSVQKFATL